MKIRLSLDVNVEMGKGDVYGTAFMGYMPAGTYYQDLVSVFGEPQSGRSPNGKIQMEWFGRINGLTFTIYDYKTSVIPRDNVDWHIGGDIKLVADLVIAYFSKARLETNKEGSHESK